MSNEVAITLRGIPPSAALEARIREKAEKLYVLCPQITRFRVIVETLAGHKTQGNEYTVRLELHIPQHHIEVAHMRHEDPYIVLRDSFDAARRQLTALLDKQRGTDGRTQEAAL